VSLKSYYEGMKKYIAALIAVLFVIPVLADKPRVNPREDSAYGRAGAPLFLDVETIAAAGELIGNGKDAVDVTNTGGDAAPKLFRYGTIIMVTCDADAIGYFLQDDGATTSATTGQITDAGSTAGRTTGNGGSFWIEAGVTRHVVVPTVNDSGNAGVYSESQVSVRKLSCTGSQNAYGRPCDVDDDCYDDGTATCVDTAGGPKGSYLKIHPSAQTDCRIEVEH